MAINPFPRIPGLDVPVALPSAVRPDPSVWSNLASIGEAIGNYREHQRVAEAINEPRLTSRAISILTKPQPISAGPD